MDTISTHSRAKAAGVSLKQVYARKTISTHSRAKAAGIHGQCPQCNMYISTHSRAKAAGLHVDRERRHTGFQLTAARRRLERFKLRQFNIGYFNSQPREGGWQLGFRCPIPISQFQLTAARRRLVSSFSACSTAFRFQLTAARRRLAKSGSDLD